MGFGFAFEFGAADCGIFCFVFGVVGREDWRGLWCGLAG